MTVGRAFIDDYLLYLLARASHQASRQFHQVIKAQGVPVPQWRVLATLDDGPRTIGDLAEITLIQQPTLTKLVDRMARDGLVRRRPHDDDRRKVVVAIAGRGAALVRRLLPQAKRHEADVLAGYDGAEAAALKRILRTLIARTDEG